MWGAKHDAPQVLPPPLPGTHVNIQAVLTLYPSNSTSCEGTESGDDISHTVPIYTGHALPHAILPLDCAGDYVIGGVMERLTDCGYHLTTTGERDLVTDVQEKLYSIALDIDTKQDAVHARRATQEAVHAVRRTLCTLGVPPSPLPGVAWHGTVKNWDGKAKMEHHFTIENGVVKNYDGWLWQYAIYIELRVGSEVHPNSANSAPSTSSTDPWELFSGAKGSKG